jgi:hypothetical protein
MNVDLRDYEVESKVNECIPIDKSSQFNAVSRGCKRTSKLIDHAGVNFKLEVNIYFSWGERLKFPSLFFREVFFFCFGLCQGLHHLGFPRFNFFILILFVFKPGCFVCFKQTVGRETCFRTIW